MDGQDWGDPMNPFTNRTSDGLSDEDIRRRVLTYKEPLRGVEEPRYAWSLGTSFQISQVAAEYKAGWNYDLTPESRFMKRPFALDESEGGLRGVAIVFRAFEPRPGPGLASEHFIGWVPQEREAEADGWIAFLNDEIRDRLAGVQSARARK